MSSASPAGPARGAAGDGVVRGAAFSSCGFYRYWLTREGLLPRRRRTMVVVGLNPSTADDQRDDPTIRRCMGFARREGCGRLVVVNLFALRATDPAALGQASDPIGPDNDGAIRACARTARVLVAAWGAHAAGRERGERVLSMLDGWRCLGLTRDGHPRHPLYLPGDAPLVAMG